MTEEMKAVSYCIGMSVAGSLKQQNLGDISPKVISEAISDMFEGKESKYTQEEADGIIQKYLQGVMEKKFEANKGISEGFLGENGERDNVQTTDSGLQIEVLTEGEGAKPSAESNVTVHYHGTLIDGTVFDSSVDRGEPATFGVSQVIKGWTEALQLMSIGSKYRLYIPQDLAYGANPQPGGPIEPFMALIFDVELLEIA
ncbi:MAG: FKBP-type peptidyl-prolyl cis-trans isomerase [Crocinitomicaceae bacterium]|nr:FKBP-type peptidyl-prolyl cis-trans isomerase [Flavobacteriales bacterium]NQZ35416.1 FKBP-type peptidyl-prolyl cis-trans isomerase [Crocinitomicaceae bacterium]PHR30857.1 MAG: peptidylprolyl isomerase [Fluviicola sp.]